MATLEKSQLHAFFRDYKKRVFELEHDTTQLAARQAQVKKSVGEILGEKSHFKFHQKIDPQNAATLDLIYDFCHEALLPPVVTRLVERVAVLEARQVASLELISKVMEHLAIDQKSS